MVRQVGLEEELLVERYGEVARGHDTGYASWRSHGSPEGAVDDLVLRTEASWDAPRPAFRS